MLQLHGNAEADDFPKELRETSTHAFPSKQSPSGDVGGNAWRRPAAYEQFLAATAGCDTAMRSRTRNHECQKRAFFSRTK